ncbi:golgin subfamily A member 6-like protein 22 [Nasonia vitripennis]|uniref:Cilia- and flagella-associated protein 157 n=1 Tax=Nasonia vitripennis TaxID=7425 RepID=A0A7M7HBZ4_NASVI|nr:golgin subfamily A member 6-like protein 22 [Nasonia vitripennis]
MKKKGGKKEKKARKKNFVNELETVTFEQQILENNRQLARLRSRNEELEAEAETLKERLNQLEENKADLTAHLQRVLRKKTEEAEELEERLVALEKVRKEEEEAFKKKEESMEHEYKTMENNLTAEIKLAAGKLNALEDWRLARIDLMNKFEDQEKRMAEQEIRHKKSLYEAEKKLIIGKAKMQNELEKRLTELAESFRAATNLRLADATQRAVRENVSLQQELNGLLNHCRELDARMQSHKESERGLRLQAALYEAEARLALNKVIKQNRLIERLAREQHRMSRAIGRARRAEEYAIRGEQALEQARLSCAEARDRARVLEQNVETSRGSRDDSMREARDNCREIEKLARILAEAKEAIRQALQVQAEMSDRGGEQEDACSSCFLDLKEKLLHALLDILASYQDPNDFERLTEIESETVIENLYEFGNLGLIPSFGGAPEATSSASSKRDIPRVAAKEESRINREKEKESPSAI